MMAILLDHTFVIRLKGFLPGESQVSIVADVHDFFRGKLLDEVRVQTLEYFSAVRNRSTPSACRWNHAKEPYPHRPVERIGLFIVQQNILISRMIGRSIYPTAQSGARRGAFPVFNEAGRKRSCEIRQALYGIHFEISKKQRSVFT